MQDRYTGDIGDFGKYALLKALCTGRDNEDALSLGVVWYLVPDEGHNSDGKHVAYLKKSESNWKKFRSGDPHLYDSLAKIVNGGKRKVSYIRENDVLLPNTTYYEKPLSFEGIPNIGPNAKAQRLIVRNQWLFNSVEATAHSNIVFLDPDNGLEVPTVDRHHTKGPKYTYYDDILPFLNRGQSLVIYHHSNRNATAEEQINYRINQLSIKFGVEVLALLYHRGTSRTFFIIPSEKSKNMLFNRAINFTSKSPWNNHFSLFNIEGRFKRNFEAHNCV